MRLDSHLEPDVKTLDEYHKRKNSDLIQLSIAISLKRIADCMDGTTAGVDISESMSQGRPNAFRF